MKYITRKYELGNRLTRCRNSKGLYQVDLAAEIDVSPKTISRWENGISVDTLEKFSRLEEILGVSLYEICTGNKLPE